MFEIFTTIIFVVVQARLTTNDYEWLRMTTNDYEKWKTWQSWPESPQYEQGNKEVPEILLDLSQTFIYISPLYVCNEPTQHLVQIELSL